MPAYRPSSAWAKLVSNKGKVIQKKLLIKMTIYTKATSERMASIHQRALFFF